jgi:predicted HAD superfamily hydrolase
MIKQMNVKSYIKYWGGKFISRIHVRKFEDAVREAEIISFDLFDTLVKRNVVKPEHVHELVEREFFRQTGIKLSDYAGRRVEAEKRARRCNSKEEISLDDIFDVLCEIPEEWKSTLKKLERRTEIEVCTPNLSLQTVYEKALRAGKHIIITSDMYLDEDTIRQILYKCGYRIYEKLYLSSSFGKCKARGSIYEIIKRDYAGCQGRILHIGDNAKGDYVIPRKKGINALLVDGQPELLKYWKKTDAKKVDDPFLHQRLYSFLNNHVGSKYSDAEAIGLEVLGPMLLGFCKWLYQRLKADKIEKIFFLSREGKILQAAFRILYPECEIEQAYLYVSRQALTVPQLADAADFDEMAGIFQTLAHIPTINLIPTVCRLDHKVFCERLRAGGMETTTKIDKVSGGDKAKLYHIIQDMGKKEFDRQKGYVDKYLKENIFMGNVAIVDIGWSGTMQKALQAFTKTTNVSLQGYYLGVRNIASDEQYTGLSRQGYLFNNIRNEKFNLMTRFTTEIIELLFSNREGSVLKYDFANGHIVPVLDDVEYGEKEDLFIKAVQKAALDFLKVVERDKFLIREEKIPEDIVMKAYSRFAVQPALSVLEIFKNFQVLNGKVRSILPEHGILYYMVHIRKLKQDFEESSCKILFLKEIFKVNLPYFEILERLLSKYDNERAK